MKLEGTFTFHGPRTAVWDLLQDPDILARALPGTERLEKVGPDQYKGVMKASVGPVSAATFDVTVTITDKVPPESYVMKIDGTGRVGHTRGSARVDLSEAGENQTVMKYASDVLIGGTIAAVGGRLLESVGKTMMKQALESLDRELRARLDRNV
jgi:carbon monoxide dehydrogenase subunit G